MTARPTPPLTRQRLRGTWASVLLPLDEQERIDDAALDRQLAVLTTSGLDGVYTNGTAGEFHSIDEDEFERISERTRAACARVGVRCQLGASHMSAPVALRRIRHAARLGPDAIQVILPDWLALSTAEVTRTIEGYAAAAGGVPLVLYNPPHAKTVLTPRDFGALADRFDALIGIKVAGGTADWYRRLREHAPDLAVFVPGHTLASGRALGADGAYSNVACLNPAGAMRWQESMASDPARALAIEQRLADLLHQYVVPLQQQGYSNAALDKALAAAGGWCDIDPRLRWPYLGVAPSDIAPLAHAARRLVPELFAEPSTSSDLAPVPVQETTRDR